MAKGQQAQITFRLPERLARRIDGTARRLGVERSELLRSAAVAYLEVADAGAQAPYARVRSLIGSVESKIPDLGTNHRRHLRRKLRRER